MRSLPLLVLMLFAAISVQCVYAAPTTQAATGISSNNLTFNEAGGVGDIWWEYGTYSGGLQFRTENTTANNWTESGLPLISNTRFFFRACDSSGCGSELSATLLQVTLNPETTYGRTEHNMTLTHMDVTRLGGSLLEPYLWATGTPLIVFGVLLFFVFAGLWIAQREVILPTILGLIGSGMLIYSGTNSVGIPPEFIVVAIGIVAAGLTGCVMGLFKR